ANAEMDGKIANGDKAVVDYDAAEKRFTVTREDGTLTKMSGFAAIGLAAAAYGAAGWPAVLTAAAAIGAGIVLGRLLRYALGARRSQAPPVNADLSASYRFKKRAAALLASLGLGVGAPRLSAGDYDKLVERFRQNPPKLVITDYDDTFLDNSDGKGLVVSPERIALLERLAAANVRVAFATNR